MHRDQRGLAADTIAIMPKDRGADRTRDEADCEDGERLQCAGQRVGRWKIQLREDYRGHLAVQQEIVPFDRRADRTGDHRAAQLGAGIVVGKRDGGDIGCGHWRSSRSGVHRPRPESLFFGELTIALAAA
jgi:hypothetical protein